MNPNGVLIRNDRDPLFGHSPNGLKEAFRRSLQRRVRRAYFFGAFAAGRLNPESDIDLILVHDTPKPFPKRGEDFLDLYDIVPALDILVYTPEEFERLTNNPALGFWQSVSASLQRFL